MSADRATPDTVMTVPPVPAGVPTIPAPAALDEFTAARLHRRLEAAADDAGLLDVAVRVVDSPLGPLLLAATSAGLVRVAFACEGHDTVLDHLAATISPRVLEAPARLDEVARQLDRYFAGGTDGFDVPLDLRLVHGFRREVVARLPAIGYGTTASYAEVAAAVGRPAAVRAVGSACAHNPLPVVVPCHRVVRSDGSTGGYLGGTAAKELLLRLERAA